MYKALAAIMLLWGYRFLVAAYVFAVEGRRIPHIKWYKKLWFCSTFFFFDIIGAFSMIIALFSKVEWKPIPHTSTVTISNIYKNT